MNDYNTTNNSEQLDEDVNKRDNNPEGVKFDDEKLQEMTASYSAISFDSQTSHSSIELKSTIDSPDSDSDQYSGDNFNKTHIVNTRPDCLELKKQSQTKIETKNSDDEIYHKAISFLKSEGTVMKDGDLVLFVAEDLENKIKLSSPITKRGDAFSVESRNSPNYLYRQALTPQLPVFDNNILNELENEARKIATSVDSITENLAAILHSASALTVGCLDTYRDAVCKTCDAVDHNIKSMYQLMAKCEELSKSMAIIYKMADKLKDMKKILDLFESTIN